jgi:hypothetical protein
VELRWPGISCVPLLVTVRFLKTLQESIQRLNQELEFRLGVLPSPRKSPRPLKKFSENPLCDVPEPLNSVPIIAVPRLKRLCSSQTAKKSCWKNLHSHYDFGIVSAAGYKMREDQLIRFSSKASPLRAPIVAFTCNWGMRSERLHKNGFGQSVLYPFVSVHP